MKTRNAILEGMTDDDIDQVFRELDDKVDVLRRRGVGLSTSALLATAADPTNHPCAVSGPSWAVDHACDQVDWIVRQ